MGKLCKPYNTNTMVGKKNSVALRFLQKNDRFFISTCPRHLAHIAASNANDAFCEYTGINEFCVQVYLGF